MRIKDVEFFVVDQDMSEALLARPFLKAIGFNLHEHLLQVRHHIDGKSINDLVSRGPKFCAVKYQGMRYGEIEDDPIELPNHLQAGFGEDAREEIDVAFQSILSHASENGISQHGEERLGSILEKHRSSFTIKLGNDDVAKVPPLSIKLKPTARPQKCPQRKYAPQQKAFIGHTIKQLEKIGAVVKNPTAKWASPALAVPKPGSDALRFAVDSRGPNSQTEPMQSAMPHLDASLQETEGNSCFANVDFCHGYWQFALAQSCQEILSIQTHLGIYTPTRMLQGQVDSGNHFQATTSQIFQRRLTKLPQWMDDFLLYASSESELLDNIEHFIVTCEEYGFKLHAKKCNFFLREAKFCGRIISKEGFRYDPRHFDSILNMKPPRTAADLQQFIAATNWMRSSIPEYSSTVQPLRDLMESIYYSVGGRTKRKVKKVVLEGSWRAIHDVAFKNIKDKLASSTKLSFPKSDGIICLFTDASDTHWSAVLTQIPLADKKKEIEEQCHELLCFLSGCFKGSAANWSVPEKEGFAIIEAMTKMDYIVAGREVAIFTDHSNLVYMYDPFGRNPGMPKHTASKLMRWALKMNEFRYVIHHLPGIRNVWADLLTRWAVQSKNTMRPHRTTHLKKLMLAPIRPGVDPEFDWPTLRDIETTQSNSKSKPSARFKWDGTLYKDNKGVIWIPTEDDALKLRIIIAAHNGPGGHRGIAPTTKSISTQFYWNGLGKDVKQFVSSCLHCLASEPGSVIPRPLAHTLHASQPNDLIHFDFCYIMKGVNDLKYILILKDDFSGYVWLIPSCDADSPSVCVALTKWFSAFGVVRNWSSDQGSHFKNQLMRSVQEATKSSHHFTTAYCPWTNGSVEVFCRELLRALRALLSEFQLPSSSWPSMVPIIQSALNNAPSRRLGGRCALTAFTGFPQSTAFISIGNLQRSPEVLSIDKVKATQVLALERLLNALDGMHKEIKSASEKARETAIRSHNAKTGVKPINFDKGDYVLRGLLTRERGRKPSLRWTGPYQVVDCKDSYVFQIQNLRKATMEFVHGRRLKFFRNSSFEVTEELSEHLDYQEGELLSFEEFRDIRNLSGNIELLVKWRGFSEDKLDWVDATTLREDVPDLLAEYKAEVSENGTKRQRQLASSL